MKRKVTWCILSIVLTVNQAAKAYPSLDKLRSEKMIQSGPVKCPDDGRPAKLLSNPKDVSQQFLDELREKAYDKLLNKPAQNWPEPVFKNRSVRPMDDGEPNIIIVDANIVSNQLWTADNIYLIDDIINVQALLVIEPGTEILLTVDGSLHVDNGGTLISVGEPDNPVIYSSPYYDPSPFDYCYIAISVEETASPLTRIEYSFIEYAFGGIMTDNIRLERPIQNNYLFSNVYGIYEYGTRHTDIVNNLFLGCHQSSIEIYMESYDGAGDANSIVFIVNNTCDWYQKNGITVHGVDDADNAGTVVLGNNIVTRATSCGLKFVEEYLSWFVYNTGYGENYINKNFDFEEYDPVQVEDNPYWIGPGLYDYDFLDQNCAFIDAGYEYIEETTLIGKTTDINSAPDCNKIDLGFHNPNWNYSNAGDTSLKADFDNDYTVDLNDLTNFADYWLYDYEQNYRRWYWDFDDSAAIDFNDMKIITDYWLEYFDFYDYADFASFWQQRVDYRFQNTKYDLNDDDLVDFKDFAVLASEWQKIGDAEPNIQLEIYGDFNEGYIDVGISGFTPTVIRTYFLIDGQYVGEIPFFQTGQTLGYDVSVLGSGPHELKAVSLTNNREVICSDLSAKTFNRSLNYCFLPDVYEPNSPLHFTAINSEIGNVSINVYANGGNLIWSESYNDGNSFSGVIPAEITRQYEFDYITFKNNSGRFLAKKTSDPAPNTAGNIQALIILPDLMIRLYDFRTISQVQSAFKSRGIEYAKLSGKAATYDKVAWYAKNKIIKYIYVDAHGNYQLDDGGMLRTLTWLNDGPVASIKKSDFIDPNDAPPWCEYMWAYWEISLNSFAKMGFGFLEFAYFDTCYGGRLKIDSHDNLIEGQPGQIGYFDGPYSDMSIALGLNNPGKSRIYQGWYSEGESSLLFETEYQKWSRYEWEELGKGETLYWAVMHTINKQTEFGPDAPVNNYRFKGQGLLTELILTND